jgi:sulfonate transport system ATP-binding protein
MKDPLPPNASSDAPAPPTLPGEALIRFDDVSMRFRTRRRSTLAVDRLSLAIPQGEFCSIVGPSGCGKSTLLNMVAGLLRPTEGVVTYRGSRIADANTRVGYVTQRDNLLPWRSVGSNVGLPLELRGVEPSLRRRRTEQILELVGLAGFEEAFPRELSGGMRKRVSLARTLLYEPEVILADEPFGALDSQLKTVLQAELLRIWERTSATVMFVTHDLGEAIALGDRVIVMSSRPSRILLDERVDLPRPRDVLRVRFEPEFSRLHDRLWDALRPEVDAEVVR